MSTGWIPTLSLLAAFALGVVVGHATERPDVGEVGGGVPAESPDAGEIRSHKSESPEPARRVHAAAGHVAIGGQSVADAKSTTGAGIAPELLQALHEAVERTSTGPGSGEPAIRIRLVSPEQCGPTVAPGSDCLVGTPALAIAER